MSGTILINTIIQIRLRLMDKLQGHIVKTVYQKEFDIKKYILSIYYKNFK